MKIDDLLYLKHIPFKSKKSELNNNNELELRVYELETYTIDNFSYSLLLSFFIEDEFISTVNIHLTLPPIDIVIELKIPDHYGLLGGTYIHNNSINNLFIDIANEVYPNQ